MSQCQCACACGPVWESTVIARFGICSLTTGRPVGYAAGIREGYGSARPGRAGQGACFWSESVDNMRVAVRVGFDDFISLIPRNLASRSAVDWVHSPIAGRPMRAAVLVWHFLDRD